MLASLRLAAQTSELVISGTIRALNDSLILILIVVIVFLRRFRLSLWHESACLQVDDLLLSGAMVLGIISTWLNVTDSRDFIQATVLVAQLTNSLFEVLLFLQLLLR